MNIKTEIIKSYVSDMICNSISNFDIDADEIADTKAIKMLEEIQQILKNDSLDDFEMVDEIVLVFHRNNIDAGVCHDF